ncbi:MAG: serine hydrolase [Gammaproteobacteria bacterium]
MTFRHIVAASVMVFTACFFGGVHAADDGSLSGARDVHLQRLLERGLERLGLLGAVRGEKLAVALVDVSDIDRPRLASVNGDHMMYAASLPKIGILLAAMYEVERGHMRYTRDLERSLTDMIRVSSNEEATRVMNLVGKRRVNQILASQRFRFYDRNANGGLWVGKEYGPRPAFERDPLHNISHGATVMQVARFYYLLEAGRLLRADLNGQMKRILSRPGLQHKFVKGLRGRNVEIFRKSGTWRQWHADSAIVESPRGNYVLVALAEDPRGGDWLPNIARTLHDAMYPPQFARK